MGDHSSMVTTTLHRQNAGLLNALQHAKSSLKETEERLLRSESSRLSAENALSVLDRTWAAAEEQLAHALSRLAAAPSAAPPSPTRLLALAVSLSPTARLEEEISRRARRMAELSEAAVAALARPHADDAAAVAARAESLAAAAQAEVANLKAQVALLADKATQAEARAAELQSQLDERRAELDKYMKELHRAKRDGACASAAAPDAAPTTAAAKPTTATPGDDDAAKAQLLRANEEQAAMSKTAAERLEEIVDLKQQLAAAQSRLQEAVARPVSDEQLRAHPQYGYLLNQQRGLTAQIQEERATAKRLAAEAAALREERKAELLLVERNRATLHEEAREQARRDAEALARSKAEKDSLQLRLGQTREQHAALVSKAEEQERVLAWQRGELQRMKEHLARSTELAQQHEAARDAALHEKETARQQAHRLELELQQLRHRAGGGGAQLSDVEKQCHDALVRLGAAEQQASQAQHDLETQRGESAALMSEMEAISQAFEEQAEQNARLMQQLAAKEEASAKLMVVRQKEAHITSLLKVECEGYREQLEAATKLNERANELRAALEQQLKMMQDAMGKREEEHSRLEQVVEQCKGEAREARSVEQQVGAHLKVLQDGEARSLEREKIAVASAAGSEAQVKRLTQERDALQRQLHHKRASEGGGGGGGTVSQDLVEQLEYYRGVVKCPLCKVNEKNAVILKCCHTFCRGCIDQRLNLRNRKCPTCGVGIDFQSVRELFLTS